MDTLRRVFDRPAEGLRKLSFEIAGESPAECAAIVKSELERWGSIVKVSGFSLDE